MEHKRLRRIALIVVAVLVVAGVALGTYQVTNNGGSPAGSGNTPASQVQLISVSGNQLMQGGKPVRLIGLNMNGAQFYCLGNNTQPLAMPIDRASISALSSWHVNSVRILFNQDCWLGIDGEPHATSSANYRRGIESLVSMLNSAHIEVILALYTNVPVNYGANGKHRALQTQPMADGTGEALWKSVATTFRNDPQVMFDLYGEPHEISWPCWKNGCKIGGQQYVGMQQLVDTVRQTGARQPILLGGVDFSNNLSEWLTYEPTDPLHQLIASAHIYSATSCNTVKCWNKELSPVSRKVPVVTGEFGATGCATTTFTQRYMKWADKHAISYLAWAWFVGTCSTVGPLISSYAGAATTYGSPFQSHLAALYNAGSGNVGSVSAGVAVAKSESKTK